MDYFMSLIDEDGTTVLVNPDDVRMFRPLPEGTSVFFRDGSSFFVKEELREINLRLGGAR